MREVQVVRRESFKFTADMEAALNRQAEGRGWTKTDVVKAALEQFDRHNPLDGSTHDLLREGTVLVERGLRMQQAALASKTNGSGTSSRSTLAEKVA